MHDAGDWPRRYLFSSDVSAGHSGGPAYFSSGGNHYVFGVAVWQDCVGASCSGTLVNGMRAITPHHAQTLKQARPASLAFWQGFREHGSGAYKGT